MTTHLYRYLADGLVVLHACLVGFIVIGFLLIVLGGWRNWAWVRNFWFRLVHLGIMICIGLEAALDLPCPLTVLERYWRALGGETAYAGDFLAHWANQLLYVDLPDWVFPVLHIGFALFVVAVFVLVPPRRPRHRPDPLGQAATA
jgi:hypothetical protein